MNKVYILRVLDNDDEYVYKTLVFDNKEEFEKAKQLIENYDDNYYNNNLDYNGDEYIDGLDELIEKHIKTSNHILEIENIFVR